MRSQQHVITLAVWLFLAAFIVPAVTLVYAQEADSSCGSARVSYLSGDPMGPELPKVGVVLSGGGARGFAEIGVLKVIEEAGIHADIITGTSMGAVLGGLYAIGYTADELEQMALSTDWMRMFNDRPSRRHVSMVQKSFFDRYVFSLPLRAEGIGLPSGLVAGQRISSLLDSLTLSVHGTASFNDLYRKFACVATDLETGQAVVLRGGSLSRALRASMAIPSVFTPVQLDSTLLVDGMLARNLPVQDCWDLGADYVIAVDVGNPLKEANQLNNVLTILDQSIAIGMQDENKLQVGLANLVIRPDLTGYTSADFLAAAELIATGEEQARAYLPRLRAVADSLYSRSGRDIPPRPVAPDSVYVESVSVLGLKDVTRAFVLDEADLQVPGWVALAELHEAVERVYSTRFFEQVTYELQPHGNSSVLQLFVTEKDVNLLRFGFRYDTAEESALLTNVTLRNPLLNATMLTLDVRLGTESSVTASYFGHMNLNSRLGFRVSGLYSRDEQALPPSILGQATTVEASIVRGDMFFGSLFSTMAVVGAGVRFDQLFYKDKFDRPGSLDRSLVYGSAYGQVQIDTFDDSYFAKQGLRLKAEAEYANHPVHWDSYFSVYSASFDWRTAIHERITLIRRGFFRFSQRDLPLPRYDTEMSYWQFFGMPHEYLIGKHMQIVEAGVMVEPWTNRFLTARFDLGNTFLNDWNTTLEWDRYDWGVGLFAGAPTPVGPVEILAATSSGDSFLFAVNVGYFF